MHSFDLILEHCDTKKLMFITVEDCKDLDDCLNDVKAHLPEFDITQIKIKEAQ